MTGDQVVWRGASWHAITTGVWSRCRACNGRIRPGSRCYRPDYAGRHVKDRHRLCVACSGDKSAQVRPPAPAHAGPAIKAPWEE